MPIVFTSLTARMISASARCHKHRNDPDYYYNVFHTTNMRVKKFMRKFN